MEASNLLNKVRQAVFSRGARTILGIGRVFRNLDSYDGNKKVDSQEFFYGLKELGVNLTQAESQELLGVIDKNKDGKIDFDEFLVSIRGDVNAARQEYIDKAFVRFDKDGNGQITINDLKGVYNCSFHPKFKSGEMTEDQIFQEFLENFSDSNKDGKIQKNEWNDYYASVSASIDNDEHFIELMKIAWKI